MILLISPYLNAPECAALIQRATRDQVKTVNSIPPALAALRKEEYTIVVADENLLESCPGSLESLVHRMAAAAPLFVDLASLRAEKVSKLVVQTWQRRQLENEFARKQVMAQLRSELKSDITGLLLSSEMILKDTLPKHTTEKLVSVLEIVKRLQARLEI
jgi:hypothetical protein